MQANDLDRDTLRRLAAAKAANGGKAISFYLNLEPTEFATPPARASQIRSLLDEGEKKLKELEGGDADRALRADFERARAFFNGDLPTDGARGLAVFCSGEGELFEVIRLPRPVQSEVVISDSPFIEPLVDLVSGTWCILLCNRRTARIFRGSSDRIEEVARVTSEDVLPQADAGGWSQQRYERGQDEEVHRHLKRVADVVHRRFRRARFDHLLVGSPEELTSDVEKTLHPDVAQRLAGRLTIDVENTTEDAVLEAARPLIEDHERDAERAALDRLKQGVGAGGRGVAGLDDVLGALNERRVETLLLEERFQMPGRVCPQCGSLLPENVAECPADESATEPYDDIVEEAVELALSQSADVIVARHHDDLEEMGGIGAVLRF
jgi:peptide subunit release factor 1 (eRF1)